MDNDALNALNNASSVITNAAGVINAANTNKRQRQWMERMYEKQRANALADTESARNYASKMWTKQNEYDSPREQLERMRAAGMNPNSSAAAIAGAAQSNSAPSPVVAPQSSMPNPPADYASQTMASYAQNMANLALTNAQAAKAKAETAKTEAETDKTYVDTQLVQEQLNGLIFDNKEIKPRQAAELEETINRIMSEKRYTDAETEIARMSTIKLISDIKEVNKRIESLQEEIKLTKEKVNTEKSIQASNKASADLAAMEKDVKAAEEEYKNLINGYERELQSLGTSTQATSNPIINQRDQAAVIAARALKKRQRDSGTNTSMENPRFRDDPVKKGFGTLWNNVKRNVRRKK